MPSVLRRALLALMLAPTIGVIKAIQADAKRIGEASGVEAGLALPYQWAAGTDANKAGSSRLPTTRTIGISSVG